MASTYGPANRLPSSASAVETNEYAYDGAGRLTNHVVNGQTRRFLYNYRGQMTALHDRDGRVFAYDFDGDPAGSGAGGNRIRQSLNDCLETRLVYDGPNVVLDLNASNEVVHAYVNALGIDQPIERIGFIGGQPRQRHVYHTEALGSIVAMTDEAGSTVKTYAYEAFGRIRAETGDSLLNRIAYTGREAMGDSGGWYYYRNRVVDVTAGRFTSEDPLGFVDSYALFTYSLRPINQSDPLGLFGVTVPGTEISAVTCWGFAREIQKFLEGGCFSGRSFCKDYKDPTNGPGNANHCMFGCLLQLVGCGVFSGFSEIFEFDIGENLQDQRENYIGVYYGTQSVDYRDCHEKCSARHCN